MLGRRSFLICCSCITAAAAVALIDRRRTPLGDPLPLQAPAGETRSAGSVLRIDGWEQPSGDGEVWISINQSWRSAWR